MSTTENGNQSMDENGDQFMDETQSDELEKIEKEQKENRERDIKEKIKFLIGVKHSGKKCFSEDFLRTLCVYEIDNEGRTYLDYLFDIVKNGFEQLNQKLINETRHSNETDTKAVSISRKRTRTNNVEDLDDEDLDDEDLDDEDDTNAENKNSSNQPPVPTSNLERCYENSMNKIYVSNSDENKQKTFHKELNEIIPYLSEIAASRKMKKIPFDLSAAKSSHEKFLDMMDNPDPNRKFEEIRDCHLLSKALFESNVKGGEIQVLYNQYMYGQQVYLINRQVKVNKEQYWEDHYEMDYKEVTRAEHLYILFETFPMFFHAGKNSAWLFKNMKNLTLFNPNDPIILLLQSPSRTIKFGENCKIDSIEPTFSFDEFKQSVRSLKTWKKLKKSDLQSLQ